MNITIKFGKKTEGLDIAKGTKIFDILKKLNINREVVVIAKNGEITPENEELRDGDKIHIITVVSGG